MRNYKAILSDIENEILSEFDIFNRNSGEKQTDPNEAVATLKAIKLYRNDREFAKAVRQMLETEEETITD